MNYPATLEKLIARTDLSEDETFALFDELFHGNLTDAQIGAFLAALSAKGETVAEIAAAARAMRQAAAKISSLKPNTVDTVGTGGDHGITFNISSTTAFVAAGAGAVVAKHGNRSSSGRTGSADCLEALGLNLACEPEVMEEALNEIGICFLFAQTFHKAMRFVGPARKQLGVRTVFNLLGPLTNPAGARTQLIGVYAPELTEVYAGVFKRLGSTHALVVHGSDGMDEITVTGPSRCSELKDGLIRTYDIDPEPIFGGYAELGELAGGDAKENAGIATGILTGKIRGAKRNVVLINAAGTLLAADLVPDLATGVKKAEESIDSGAAYEKLRRLVEISNS